jgi:glutamate synthase (NADPH/NADH) large chain
VVERGKLLPGKIFFVDTETGHIYRDDELKAELASKYPYEQWLKTNRTAIGELQSGRTVTHSVDNFAALVHAFHYTKEDVERLIVPMVNESKEPVGSMGNDATLAALSRRQQLLFRYFRQQFAQVTNPPIDPIREELVMSNIIYIGTLDSNLLQPDPKLCKMVRLNSPILTNQEFDLLCHLEYKGFRSMTIPVVYDASSGAAGLEAALDNVCKQAERAVDDGFNYIVLSDRATGGGNAPIPSLLALSAVHHYLIDVRKRAQIGILIESAEPREVMHFALLLGFGASAINPYMAYAVIDNEIKRGNIRLDINTAVAHYVTAINKGLLKAMSKMGISTMSSYRGAKIFEALGISEHLAQRYFGGINTTIGGVDLADIAAQQAALMQQAATAAPTADDYLADGFYSYRKGGEQHAWNPETISALQAAVRGGSYEKFKEYTRIVDGKQDPIFIRDLLEFKTAGVSRELKVESEELKVES